MGYGYSSLWILAFVCLAHRHKLYNHCNICSSMILQIFHLDLLDTNQAILSSPQDVMESTAAVILFSYPPRYCRRESLIGIHLTGRLPSNSQTSFVPRYSFTFLGRLQSTSYLKRHDACQPINQHMYVVFNWD